MRKQFIILLLCFLPISAKTQVSLNNTISMPSVDVWNFMKYGDVGTNLYTGTLNLKIPFYTYKDADFEIPISFDYSSNGYMPNIRTGILGLGWNLNAGGYITREVKGLPDEHSGVTLGSSIGTHGYNSLPICSEAQYNARGFSFLWNTEQFVPSFDNLFSTCAANSNVLFYGGYNNFFDAEPDIFHFNFMGYSGSFQLGYNKEIHVFNTNTNNNNFKIEINLPSIFITTETGYIYVFGYVSTQRITATDYTWDEGHGTSSTVNTAFKLLEIIAPNGRRVKFYYSQSSAENYYMPLQVLIKEHHLWSPTGGQIKADNNNISAGQYGDTEYSTTYTCKLDSIAVGDKLKIIFTHTQLSGIEGHYSSINNNTIEYIINSNKLSAIKVLNTANQHIIKQADILYKYTESTTGNKIPLCEKINISGEGEYLMNYYNETGSFPYLGNCTTDHWGYYNGIVTSWGTFVTSDIQNVGPNETCLPTYRSPHAEYAKMGMLKEIIYPTKGKSVFEYEAHSYSNKVNRKSGGYNNITDSDEIAGGVRIKKITNFIENGAERDSKEFLYVNANGRSSGRLLYFPHYSIKYGSLFHDYVSIVFYEKFEGYFLSGITPVDMTHIEYDRVIEKNTDSSKIIYYYSNYSNIPDRYTYRGDIPSLGGDFVNYVKEGVVCPIFGSNLVKIGTWLDNTDYIYPHGTGSYNYLLIPPNSMHGERGKLLSKEIFGADGNPVVKETSIYNTYKTLKYFPAAIYLIRAYSFHKRYVDNYDLTGTTKKQYFANEEISENTTYTYNSGGQVSTTTVIDSKGDRTVTKRMYVTDLSNTSGIYGQMLLSNRVNEPLEDSVYIIKAGTNTKQLVEWRKYNYYQPIASKRSLIRLQSVDEYDLTSSSWVRSAEFTHDTLGRTVQKIDRNGLYTSYIWGYGGLYPVAKIDNCSLHKINTVGGLTAPLESGLTSAQETALRSITDAEVTTFEYTPFVGLRQTTDASGKSTVYRYNATGKLKSVIDDSGSLQNKYFYSTDDKRP